MWTIFKICARIPQCFGFSPTWFPLAPVLWNTQPNRFGRPIYHSEPGLTILWREVDHMMKHVLATWDTCCIHGPDAKNTLKDSSKKGGLCVDCLFIVSLAVFFPGWIPGSFSDNHALTPPIQVQGENSGEPPCQFILSLQIETRQM